MVGTGEIRCIIGRPALQGIEPNIELERLGNAPNVSKLFKMRPRLQHVRQIRNT
jgi:hypothetical protein